MKEIVKAVWLSPSAHPHSHNNYLAIQHIPPSNNLFVCSLEFHHLAARGMWPLCINIIAHKCQLYALLLNQITQSSQSAAAKMHSHATDASNWIFAH